MGETDIINCEALYKCVGLWLCFKSLSHARGKHNEDEGMLTTSVQRKSSVIWEAYELHLRKRSFVDAQSKIHSYLKETYHTELRAPQYFLKLG